MYLTTMGLVLRVTAYKDKDALLTLLTPDNGKLTVKARGLYRKNSPLVAPCQLLAYGEFTLFEYRDMFVINEAHSEQLFHDLRKDLCKLSLGTYFAQVADLLGQEDMPTQDLLPLVLNCLYAISNLSLPPEQVKAVFELRAACLAGYTPELSHCHYCGNKNPDRFNISEGVLECAVCRDSFSDGIRMPLTPGVLDCIRYICTCSAKDIFRFSAGEQTIGVLSQISEAYLIRQLEHGFSTLDFYKSLLLST